jgi:hypothetical protein
MRIRLVFAIVVTLHSDLVFAAVRTGLLIVRVTNRRWEWPLLFEVDELC